MPSEADSSTWNRVCTANHSAEHPETDLLERFLRGELSGADGRAECRNIVRHLLSGCPRCTRITGRLWALGEPPSGEPL